MNDTMPEVPANSEPVATPTETVAPEQPVVVDPATEPATPLEGVEKIVEGIGDLV